jgi:hypothetical protein
MAAKFPYTVSGTSVTNPDGSITVSWQVKNAGAAVVLNDSHTFPQGTQPAEIARQILLSTRGAAYADFALADLPASFNFSVGFADLL